MPNALTPQLPQELAAFDSALRSFPRLGARLAVGAVSGEKLLPESSPLQQDLELWVQARSAHIEGSGADTIAVSAYGPDGSDGLILPMASTGDAIDPSLGENEERAGEEHVFAGIGSFESRIVGGMDTRDPEAAMADPLRAFGPFSYPTYPWAEELEHAARGAAKPSPSQTKQAASANAAQTKPRAGQSANSAALSAKDALGSIASSSASIGTAIDHSNLFNPKIGTAADDGPKGIIGRQIDPNFRGGPFGLPSGTPIFGPNGNGNGMLPGQKGPIFGPQPTIQPGGGTIVGGQIGGIWDPNAPLWDPNDPFGTGFPNSLPGIMPGGGWPMAPLPPFNPGQQIGPWVAPNAPGFPGQFPTITPNPGGIPGTQVKDWAQILEENQKAAREIAEKAAQEMKNREKSATAAAMERAKLEAKLATVDVSALCDALLQAVCERDQASVERVLSWMRQRELIEAARPFVEPACHIAAISRGSAEIIGRLFDHGFSAGPFRREFFPFLLACQLDPATTRRVAETLFERKCGLDPASTDLFKRVSAILGAEKAQEAQAMYEKDAIAASIPSAIQAASTPPAPRPSQRL